MNGWIKIYRKLCENKLWLSEPFTRAQAWMDLLIAANHDGSSFFIRGHEVRVNRGQIGWSEITLATRWKWSRAKVRRFMAWLETEQQIVQQKSNLTSIVTIVNYDKYQGVDNDVDETKSIQQKDSRRYNKRYTYKNDKNDKNTDNGKTPVTFESARDTIANGLSFKSKSGITTPWQDKGFRYAEYLGIELKDQSLKGRWLKFFKDNAANGKVDATVSYLKDSTVFSHISTPESKMLYFFSMVQKAPKLALIAVFCLFSFICVSDGVFAATVTRKVIIQPKLTIARPLVNKAPTHKPTDEVTSSDRRESKQAKRETLQASSAVTSQAILPASASIASYKKLLTEEANEVRNKLLPQIYADYDADNALALDNILKKEAGYRPDAINEIGAGGMPQALPYSKMGCDLAWTDEAVQCQYAWIKVYIANRYGSPIEAWQFHVAWGYY